MLYKDFQELKLSALGFGNMRLPVIGGDDGKIDEAKAEEMLTLAFEKGVNYFDTAWGYHGENSELVVGRILKKLPRDKFYLATKFPGYDVSNFGKTEKIFERQLEKCQVDYFDFYLFHNICEMNIEQYLDDEKYGTYKYLIEQKKNGRIKHLGFSVHSQLDTMKRFLDAYGADMEFCQIELNYFDYKFQDAKAKLELLREMNIPVWVMEPVRGGMLASLSPENEAKLKAARPNESIVGWAFRFLQSFPEVTMTLSGMSDLEQTKENIKTFETDEPLNEEEMKLLLGIADEMISNKIVPCTACHYCVSHCPKNLDIPTLLKLYNEAKVSGSGVFIAMMGLNALEADKQPDNCISCRSCERVCPQQIKISEVLSDFAANRPHW